MTILTDEISQVLMWKNTNIHLRKMCTISIYRIITHANVVIIANAIKIRRNFAKQSVLVQQVSKIKNEFQTQQVVIV